MGVFFTCRRTIAHRPLCLLVFILSWAVIYIIFVEVKVEGKQKVHDELARTDAVRQSDVYEERLQSVRRHCQHLQNGSVLNLYLHSNSKNVYCPIAKIGSTFWKRIFLFLHNDTGKFQVKTPFEIPRAFVHYGRKDRTQVLRLDQTTSELIMNGTKRFMFVREPYARLFSTFLDKFYLPDFWRSFGHVITKRRPAVTEKAAKCGNDVSFEEFLEFVASSNPEKTNEHWKPIKFKCDPCQFKPDFIGKQETFNVDAMHVLKGIGLDWIMDTIDYNGHVKEEISMLVEYNIKLITKAPFYASCTDTIDVAKRLWKVFQINGYLPFGETAEKAIADLGKSYIDSDTLTDYIIKIYQKYPAHERKSWKANRKHAIRKAYQSIPTPLLQKLKMIYMSDFEAFGYDSEPPV